MTRDPAEEREAIRTSDEGLRELDRLLQICGARATLDSRRNVNDPCWRCGEKDAQRTLVEIGRYTRPVGGNLRPGDAIMRPLCAPCEEATRP